MASREADVVVIGGGPGGYPCAIRASQLGLKTVLVEKDRLGGECLTAGCIPSKSIISVAKAYDRVKEGSRFGIVADGLRIDYTTLQSWKSGVISTLEAGIASICRGYGVDVVKGEAEVAERSKVNVTTPAGVEEIAAKNIVFATGSHAVSLPGLEFDGRLVIGSREALELKRIPARMLIVGGGYIGMEIAGMYQRFGSEVHVVELLDRLLSGTEQDLVRYVQRNLVKRGATVYLRSKVTSVQKGADSVTAKVQTPDGEVTIAAGVVLVSVGRRPTTDRLNLSRLGVQTDEKGYVKTDVHMMTSVQGVYAIGDVRGEPLLAHKAHKEGVVAAESIAGLPTAADWKTVPWAIFTDPEIAGAGMTEKQAVDAGYRVKKSRFPFAALGRALAAGEPDGFVRIISDARTGVVLGVQVVGPEASDLVSEAALAIEMGATVEDLALTMHPHPTLPEALMEAADVALGQSVHQLDREQ
jgi:dihydrolipoamide dehydrogenase